MNSILFYNNHIWTLSFSIIIIHGNQRRFWRSCKTSRFTYENCNHFYIIYIWNYTWKKQVQVDLTLCQKLERRNQLASEVAKLHNGEALILSGEDKQGACIHIGNLWSLCSYRQFIITMFISAIYDRYVYRCVLSHSYRQFMITMFISAIYNHYVYRCVLSHSYRQFMITMFISAIYNQCVYRCALSHSYRQFMITMFISAIHDRYVYRCVLSHSYRQFMITMFISAINDRYVYRCVLSHSYRQFMITMFISAIHDRYVYRTYQSSGPSKDNCLWEGASEIPSALWRRSKTNWNPTNRCNHTICCWWITYPC